MIKGGYRGKILRVDLTKSSIAVEALPDESILRKYVGGLGLGLWYLMKELPMGAAPLDPVNPLIFLNGPLVGTRAPSSNNCTISTLNANTGFTAGRAHSHGWFGPYLSMAGYDGIIITGSSDKWVYIWIDDDKVELRDAAKVLGKDTHETEDLVKEELGVNKKLGAPDGASVAAIGPAGENLCAGALIENDKNHSFAHSGVGRIMGSKRLKAIAVRGTGKVPVFDDNKLKAVVADWSKSGNDKGVWTHLRGSANPSGDYKWIRNLVGLSAKNWLSNDIPGFGDGMSQNKITSKPCFRCPLGCAYDVEMTSGPYKGLVASMGGGGENLEGSASIVGVGSNGPGEIFYLTEINDRLGFEASAVGCSMAVAFEAYEKGLLTKEDTDGLELKWGDVKVIETLVRRIANKEGRFATSLADGPKAAAERVGLPDSAVHIKGSGMNLHDWRRSWGCLLACIVSSGSGWHTFAADSWWAEPDAGYAKQADPLDPTKKADEVAKTAILKFWRDCIGCCTFVTSALPDGMKFTAQAIGAAVGWEDFTREEGLVVGQRVIALERIFNMKHGLTADDDIKVSPRLTDPAPADAGPAAGLSIAPYLEGWVRDYYEILGWERKSGKPTMPTLKRLGMEEFTDVVWG